MVRCDIEGCPEHAEDRYGWGSGATFEVPPGWTRVRIDVRTREANGDTATTYDWSERHYCPLHTAEAVKAATR